MREHWEFIGRCALICFLIANVYVPARVIQRKILPNNMEAKWILDRYLTVHIIFNLIGMTCEFFHGHYAESRPILLKGAMLMTIWLCITGGFLRYRILSDDHLPFKLLSVQQTQFLLLLALAMMGHALM